MGTITQMPERHPDGKQCDCEGPLKMVGYNDCIMGTVDRFGLEHPVYLYDVSKVIGKMVERDGMTEDEAYEYFDFNMLGSWVGDGAPAFFYPKEDS